MVDNLLTFYYVVMKKKIQYNYILELLNELFFLILDLIEISVSTAKLNLFLNDFDIKKKSPARKIRLFFISKLQSIYP